MSEISVKISSTDIISQRFFFLVCGNDIKFSMTSFLSQNALLLQDYQTFSHLISSLLLSSGVGFLAIRSLWSLENGQLGIYDLAINALASVCAAKKPDQEFTTIKINEGRSFGFLARSGNWQITGNFSQIFSKSLRGIFCALQSRDRKRGAHQSNKGFLVATSELKKVSRHVVCSTH